MLVPSGLAWREHAWRLRDDAGQGTLRLGRPAGEGVGGGEGGRSVAARVQCYRGEEVGRGRRGERTGTGRG
ncbi:hypothetical protein Esi_0014_0231 [Ectocarpus siliculosus]|uniref:Uncharacterized protein n=1 Tax=Ectocarpus siliculosus TaxID=2880 RepID=D8LF33_ECTSI|nr:hypothetical protein Esi_0014_0231 [Ectocarpus siliculosus]|eukprot:CBN79853.1 hypothetical protein Esi_0014_0231 [Ectocarpus siliculosus]